MTSQTVRTVSMEVLYLLQGKSRQVWKLSIFSVLIMFRHYFDDGIWPSTKWIMINKYIDLFDGKTASLNGKTVSQLLTRLY